MSALVLAVDPPRERAIRRMQGAAGGTPAVAVSPPPAEHDALVEIGHGEAGTGQRGQPDRVVRREEEGGDEAADTQTSSDSAITSGRAKRELPPCCTCSMPEL